MTTLADIGLPYTKANEGCRLVAYQDTRGIWTIGFGETGPGIGPGVIWTQAQADSGFNARWTSAASDAEISVSNPCWEAMGIARQAVLVDMAYQLGQRGLREFVTMRRLLEAHQWDDAAADALKSLAAQQTPDRWRRHAQILRLGDAAIIDGALPTS